MYHAYFIYTPSSCIEIVLKSYRLGSEVLGTPSNIRDGQDRFPGQSGISQTDPKGQETFEFFYPDSSHF